MNGLEGIASSRNEVLLVLDELKQAAPEDVAHSLYMLSQGKGKQRAGRSGQARSAKTWNLAYLSTGEVSTRTYINMSVGSKATAGQEVRCLDIRVPPETGVFKKGSNPQENAALAAALKTAANDFYGVAGPAFLHKIVTDRDGVKARLSLLRKEFETHPAVRTLLGAGADGQVLGSSGMYLSSMRLGGWRPN